MQGEGGEQRDADRHEGRARRRPAQPGDQAPPAGQRHAIEQGEQRQQAQHPRADLPDRHGAAVAELQHLPDVAAIPVQVDRPAEQGPDRHREIARQHPEGRERRQHRRHPRGHRPAPCSPQRQGQHHHAQFEREPPDGVRPQRGAVVVERQQGVEHQQRQRARSSHAPQRAGRAVSSLTGGSLRIRCSAEHRRRPSRSRRRRSRRSCRA